MARPAFPRLVRRPPAAIRASLLLVAAAVASAAPAAAQTLDDGLTVPRRQLRTTVEYGHEWWDEYWEGTLERDNENIGTLTTRSVTWMGAYGVTDRVSIVATLPYIWNEASRGVLHEMRGSQDVTLGAKARLLRTPLRGRARLDATALVAVGAPTSDYTPDFLPLSIGLGSRRAVLRGAFHLQDRSGVFLDGSAGHTWRSTVHLDRPAYYSEGELVLSDEVAMPDVADYGVSVGWQRGRLCLPIGLAAQRTLGGGDIRRQDMPFVSNRMDFTRLQARAMYTLPGVSGITVHLGGMRTLSGRNVGRSSAISAGVTTAFRL
jgi:hypothetical protein